MFNDLDDLNGIQGKFFYKDLQDTDKASFNALIGRNKQGKNVSIDFERTPHVLIRRCKW